MEDNRSLIMGIITAICCVTVLLAPVACTMYRHKIVAEASASGRDPIAVRCAMQIGDTQPDPICIIKAQQGVAK